MPLSLSCSLFLTYWKKWLWSFRLIECDKDLLTLCQSFFRNIWFWRQFPNLTDNLSLLVIHINRYRPFLHTVYKWSTFFSLNFLSSLGCSAEVTKGCHCQCYLSSKFFLLSTFSVHFISQANILPLMSAGHLLCGRFHIHSLVDRSDAPWALHCEHTSQLWVLHFSYAHNPSEKHKDLSTG